MKILKKIACVILIIALSVTATKSITTINQKPIILGDVNQDGKIDNADILCVQRHILGVESLRSEVMADMNLDKEITIVDLALIKRYITR